MIETISGGTATPGQDLAEPIVVGYPDHKGVEIERVYYPNSKASTRIAANLFVPASLDRSNPSKAILVGHPFLGVKEQTAGLYAQLLAEQGFIAVAFDASHYGDSTGEPRFQEDPATRVEDFSAGIDFLSNLPLVDPERIGVLGICGGGGYAVRTAQLDHRVKAIATVSMYDLGHARRQGLDNDIPFEAQMRALDEVGRERTKEARGEAPRFFNMATDLFGAGEIGPKTAAQGQDLMGYYTTERGFHPHCTGQFTFSSLGTLMGFFPFVQIETISPRPLLMLVGGEAASKGFSEEAYSKAAEPKELFVVPGATHADLYDRKPFIGQSLDKLTQFFTDNLN
jgi:fermentation-respiration switch protein FrsA (DUF1100 family)